MNAALLFATLAAGAPALKDKPKGDHFGVWEVVSHTTAGRESKLGGEYTFAADGTWGLVRKGAVVGVAKRPYEVDVKASPQRIDLKSSATAVAMRGIFEVKGDTMRLCYARINMDRPTEYASTVDNQWTLIELRRVKK